MYQNAMNRAILIYEIHTDYVFNLCMMRNLMQEMRDFDD